MPVSATSRFPRLADAAFDDLAIAPRADDRLVYVQNPFEHRAARPSTPNSVLPVGSGVRRDGHAGTYYSRPRMKRDHAFNVAPGDRVTPALNPLPAGLWRRGSRRVAFSIVRVPVPTPLTRTATVACPRV